MPKTWIQEFQEIAPHRLDRGESCASVVYHFGSIHVVLSGGARERGLLDSGALVIGRISFSPPPEARSVRIGISPGAADAAVGASRN